MTPHRGPLPALLAVAAALVVAAAGCGGIGSGRSPNSGADAGDSLYRAENFAEPLGAVKDRIGPEGGILTLRIEARRASFAVRKGATEQATGYSALAGQGDDLSDFDVGSDTPNGQAVPASDVTASALTRMEAAARERDPGAHLGEIQYFELEYDTGAQRPEWRMNVHGRLYLADVDGRNFHNPGEGAGTADAPDISPVARSAIKLSQCIGKAGGDVDKIQRCQRRFPVP